MVNPSDESCILCSEPLTVQNRTQEHAIPRAIGGRIVSNKITCSGCNNASGSNIDKHLFGCYFPVAATLSEFLPADSDVIGSGSGRAIVTVGKNKYAGRMPLDPERSAKGTYVATGPGGQKIVVAGTEADAADAHDVAKKIGCSKYGEGHYRIETVSPTAQPQLQRDNIHPPQSVSVQCGVLKAGLLAFAALGAKSFGVDFRLRVYDTVRNTIKAVNGGSPTNGGLVHVPALPGANIGVTLGIHQELLPKLQDFRKLVSFPRTDFEHFAILSANAATQTLEMFVVLFSAHVFAFRFTNNWVNGDLVLAAVNGILKDSGYTQEAVRREVNPFLPTHSTDPAHGGVHGQPPHMDALIARAKAYWFRNSVQCRRVIRNDIAHCGGTLGRTVAETLCSLYPKPAGGDAVQKWRADLEAGANKLTAGKAPTDEQISQAANWLADAIDDLAEERLFPSSYGPHEEPPTGSRGAVAGTP